MNRDILKAGLLILDREGRMLLCRKNRDTALLITPGGRIEPGESAEECIRRELTEELGSEARVGELRYVGTYRDVAAGAEDCMVEIQLYGGELHGEPSPCAEIAELIWFSSGDDWSLLSASLRNQILPDLIRRSLIPAR